VKLNHLDLQVSDVPATVVFFESLFGLECQTNRSSGAIAILSDHSGFVLVLQKKKAAAETYPEGFHLGFLVDEVAILEQVQARARAHSVQVSELITNNRGVMIYCRSPEGFLVEVSVRRLRT
jgi:catechol-2,3-dioxygenase